MTEDKDFHLIQSILKSTGTSESHQSLFEVGDYDKDRAEVLLTFNTGRGGLSNGHNVEQRINEMAAQFQSWKTDSLGWTIVWAPTCYNWFFVTKSDEIAILWTLHHNRKQHEDEELSACVLDRLEKSEVTLQWSHAGIELLGRLIKASGKKKAEYAARAPGVNSTQWKKQAIEMIQKFGRNFWLKRLSDPQIFELLNQFKSNFPSVRETSSLEGKVLAAVDFTAPFWRTVVSEDAPEYEVNGSKFMSCVCSFFVLYYELKDVIDRGSPPHQFWDLRTYSDYIGIYDARPGEGFDGSAAGTFETMEQVFRILTAPSDATT